MPVLGNVVLMPYPQGYASLTLGCLTLAALSGLVYWQIRVCPDVEIYAFFTCESEMILYSPVRYFFVHNCGTNHQRTNFFMGYLWFFILEQPFSIEFFLLSV